MQKVYLLDYLGYETYDIKVVEGDYIPYHTGYVRPVTLEPVIDNVFKTKDGTEYPITSIFKTKKDLNQKLTEKSIYYRVRSKHLTELKKTLKTIRI